MVDPSAVPFYGRPLLREEMVDLRIKTEDSLNSLYIKMLDYIDVLESKISNLERRNRELRGINAKVG